MKARTESGRTLMEMLAVLAISGILTAGLAWGYMVAVERYRFNNFVNDLQLMVGASAGVFNHPQAQKTYYITDLYRIGIMPEDWYKTASGRPNSAEERVRNPLTRKQSSHEDVTVRVLDGGWKLESACTSGCTTNEGKVSAPASRNAFFYLAAAFPKKYCMRILMYNWKKVDDNYVIGVPLDGTRYLHLTAPLPQEDADKVCNCERFNSLVMSFYLYGAPKKSK